MGVDIGDRTRRKIARNALAVGVALVPMGLILAAVFRSQPWFGLLTLGAGFALAGEAHRWILRHESYGERQERLAWIALADEKRRQAETNRLLYGEDWETDPRYREAIERARDE